MNEIKIPNQLVEDFISQSKNESENGNATGENSYSGITGEVLSDIAKQVINLGVEAFDTRAKQRGLPGMGGVNPGDYSELAYLVAKKRLPKEWLENSPEAGLFLVTAGVLINNQREANRIASQKKDKKDGN